MIHALLSVSLLVMGVGAKASTPIINKEGTQTTQTQKLTRNLNKETPTQSSYTLELFNNYINLYNNDTQNVTLSNGQTYIERTSKMTYYPVSNDALRVNSVTYAQNAVQNGTGNNRQYTSFGSLSSQDKSFRRYTNALLQTQITPQLTTLDNNLTINIATRIEGDEQNTHELVLRTIYLYGQAQILQNNFNLANYFTPAILYDTFTSIYDNGSYTLTKGYIDTPIEQSASQEIYNVTFDVHIPKDNTNTSTYVYALSYVYLVVHDEPQTWVTLVNANQYHAVAMYYGSTIKGIQINASINYEVVDIPSIMWEILTMPFAFISTAFNLTLFPGTPYQVNIANLMLMIIGVLVFIFIFKLLIKR